MIYLRLFISFCIIGVLAFGGGYAALPLIQEQCIEINQWLSMSEFSDLLTISQITPGPIAINSATFVGMKVAGIPGAIVASLGFMFPPFIIVTLLFLIFKKYGHLTFMQDIINGLKPAVVALVAVAALGVLTETLWDGAEVALASIDMFSAVLVLAAFIIIRKWKTNIITTILACGVLGVLWEFVSAFLV